MAPRIILAGLSIVLAGADDSLRLAAISGSFDGWDAAQALAEVQPDVDRLVAHCAARRTSFTNKVVAYADTRAKGPRNLALAVVALAQLLESGVVGAAARAAAYDEMMDLALLLNGTFVDMYGTVEEKSMRGWPFVIKGTTPEFDSYQGGHVAEAVALAAEQAAVAGARGTAASLAGAVAAFLHDGFLTGDPERTKVASPGVVVYVPDFSSDGRRARWAEHHGHTPIDCLGEPQALNHGLMAAQAGVALLRAHAAIDWDGARWAVADEDGAPLGRETFVADLEAFVEASTKTLRRALKKKRTKDKAADRYEGPVGTAWYKWRYRDVSGCEAYAGSPIKDRWEDVGHSLYEAEYVAKVRALGARYYGSSKRFGLRRRHVRRLLVTCLNRLVRDRAAVGGARFACDVHGSVTNEKSCRLARQESERHLYMPNHLALATAARDDPKARCDALSLVDVVLPLFLEGHADFHAHGPEGVGGICDKGSLISALIDAKYHFYWYEHGRAACLASSR
ncbi:hypothetical protein JL721_5671 [Aureococcus anophagefferens]|nr:hypothetical protein JL721_5671 [Aureococcus anophagefferens]